jgi:hypothetical protein
MKRSDSDGFRMKRWLGKGEGDGRRVERCSNYSGSAGTRRVSLGDLSSRAISTTPYD